MFSLYKDVCKESLVYIIFLSCLLLHAALFIHFHCCIVFGVFHPLAFEHQDCICPFPMSVLLFNEIYHNWQVVAEAIEPYSTRVRTLGIALVLAIALEQIVAAEYVVVAEFQA